MRRSLAPLGERGFRLMFTAQVVSFAGSAVAPVALAFAVLDLTGDEADLGLVLAARSLPQVVFLLVGGVLADRLPRHLVMVAANLVSFASQAAVAALLLSGSAEVWMLAALAAVNGVAAGFFFPASQGILPQLIREDLRQEGNSLMRLSRSATAIGGPALGGVLVAAINPGVAIAADSLSYLLAAALLVPLRLPALAGGHAPSFLRELREGWDEFRSRTWLWVIVIQFGFLNAAETGCEQVLGPGVAKEQLGGAAAWGLVLAAQGIGLIAGGLLMLWLRPQHLLRTASLGMFLTLPVLAALAVPAPLAVVVAAGVLSGIGLEIFGVLWDTTMQQEIPPERLARVYSYDAVGSFVLIPVGFAAAGPIAQALGTPATFWAALAVIGGTTLAVLCVGDVRQLRRREPLAAPA